MDHTIIPQEWKKFLAAIQTIYPGAIIAGGALRDTIVENPVKDVDVFIQDLDPDFVLDPDELQKIADLFGIKYLGTDDKPIAKDHIKLVHDVKAIKAEAFVEQVKVDANYITAAPNSNRAHVESFINYIVDIQYNGMKYQLIFIEMEPVSYVYNDFDFGICKVYFDGVKMVVTEEFWYDLEHKQLTISGKFSAGQLLHTLYVHRSNLIKKFPGWKVVVDDLAAREPKDMPPSYRELLAIEPEKKPKDPLTVSYVWIDNNGVEQTRTKIVSSDDREKSYKPTIKEVWEKEYQIHPNRHDIDRDAWAQPVVNNTWPIKPPALTRENFAREIEKLHGFLSKKQMDNLLSGGGYWDAYEDADGIRMKLLADEADLDDDF